MEVLPPFWIWQCHVVARRPIRRFSPVNSALTSPNLVPIGRDHFVQRRGSLTSGSISDWPIKSFSSHSNFFANQKTVSTLISFWQVICVHINLIRLKTVKKSVYLDKFRNHATMTFCSKNFLFSNFWKLFQCFFFNEMLYFYATEHFKFACCYAHSKHERTCRRD